MVIESIRNGAIDKAEITGVNPPLFPDIKTSDSVLERRAKILSRFASRIGERTPYNSSEFEYASPIGEAARLALVRGMVLLPGAEGLELFRASESLKYISENEANHKALDRMYEGPVLEDPESFAWSRLFIENTHNSMAVRNRLRIVEKVFTSHMREAFSRKEGPFQVLSVAAGSSRAIMESLKDLNGTASDRIVLQMVDNSDEALFDGQQLVGKLGIEESVKFTKANFLPITKYLDSSYHPEFVEVVGLFDYLKDAHIARFLRELRPHMADGGVIIYSNITPNDEQDFTHKVVGWREMVYRTNEDLVRLAIAAGFEPSKTRTIQEPLGVYNLVVATK